MGYSKEGPCLKLTSFFFKLKKFKLSLEYKFWLTIKTKNKTLHYINLTPDNEESIKNIKIYVDADKLEIETLIIYDLEGGITKYIISEFIPDSDIDDNIFNLNILN